MNARHQHLRTLNVLREALRRIAAHAGTFTIPEIGTRIDADFMPSEIPPGVPRLIGRLVEKGLLLRVEHGGYRVPEDGEQALLELTQVVRRAHPLLEEVVAALPAQGEVAGLAWLDRLLGADILTEPNTDNTEVKP